MLYLAKGDVTLAAGDYEQAIDLYSVAIDLNSTSGILFTNRCKAELEVMLWEDALLDAHKVR
jgi:tetratricopeptide (TPR) repeat protein